MDKYKVVCRDIHGVTIVDKNVDESQADSEVTVLNALADVGEVYYKELDTSYAPTTLKEQTSRIQALLTRVNFNLFGKRFMVFWELDKKTSKRVYLQVSYLDKCRLSGKEEVWYGRKWYLSDHMTDDEIVKTAYAACKAAVEHEVMEAFTVDGRVLFNPHVSFEALLSISDNEVRREANNV